MRFPPSSYASFSNSAPPNACSTPPCNCPSTMVLLVIVPQSSTTTYLTTLTLPDSASRVTAHRCAPLESLEPSNVNTELADSSSMSRPIRISAGVLSTSSCCALLTNAPFRTSSDSACTPRTSDAFSRSCDLSLRVASITALPPVTADLLPYVPTPIGIRTVSPQT